MRSAAFDLSYLLRGRAWLGEEGGRGAGLSVSCDGSLYIHRAVGRNFFIFAKSASKYAIAQAKFALAYWVFKIIFRKIE